MDISGSFLANWWRKNPVDDMSAEEVIQAEKIDSATA
jgi:hypothetical protein